ncbi:MAG TPA: DedA family protein [Pelomicrobium sp.]|nr:DedA family protein [Pelomicrobium sp.]
MDFEALISTYGYLAVLIGAFLEGETIVALAGFAARRGYLELPWVVLTAFAGTLCSDQFYFYLGRRHGAAWLARRPRWRARVDQVTHRLERHQTLFILSFRFLYGLRTAAPFAIGLSRVPALKFLLLNVIGAAAWSALIAGLGYAFGHALEALLDDIKRYEVWVLTAVVALIVLARLLLRLRERRRDGDGRAA